MAMTMDYDGMVFRPVSGRDATALGHYHQDGDLVWAEFASRAIRTGRLVGRCAADGTITATYCQVMADGSVVAGRCRSTPSRLGDGRLRLTERWQRLDGSAGVSEIEQATQAEVAQAGRVAPAEIAGVVR